MGRLIDNCLLGSIFLPQRISANQFLVFRELLDYVPKATRQNIWFKLNGAQLRYGRNVRNHQIFPDCWTGRLADAPVLSEL